MEVVDIKKILVPNLLIHIYLHCVRSLSWCATTLATLSPYLMDKGLIELKWVLINWLKIPQTPPNLSAHAQKFDDKMLHWAPLVRGYIDLRDILCVKWITFGKIWHVMNFFLLRIRDIHKSLLKRNKIWHGMNFFLLRIKDIRKVCRKGIKSSSFFITRTKVGFFFNFIIFQTDKSQSSQLLNHMNNQCWQSGSRD